MVCVATVQGGPVAPQPTSTTGWPCGTDLQAFNMYKLWCYQGLYWSFQGCTMTLHPSMAMLMVITSPGVAQGPHCLVTHEVYVCVCIQT